MYSILVIDDDPGIVGVLKLWLTHEGYEVITCSRGDEAVATFEKSNPDLIILDVMLPGVPGYEICKTIKKNSDVPIIMLTAKDLVEDKLHAFELGADDYIVKPFEPRELIARVKVRLKGKSGGKTVSHPQGIAQLGQVTVDIRRYEVKCEDVKMELKPKEIQLLYFLMKNKDIVFNRDQLLQKVWEYDFSGDTRTVDVHIKTLRKQLDQHKPGFEIKTVWGVGYKLEAL